LLERTGQQRKHLALPLRSAKGSRHARLQLRQSHGAELACGPCAKGLKITLSQSLELIAKAFGVADWNTLAAAAGR
jgi:hypothetical protein